MYVVRTGQAHRTLIGHTGPITCLQFDEMHLISGSMDKSIKVCFSTHHQKKELTQTKGGNDVSRYGI